MIIPSHFTPSNLRALYSSIKSSSQQPYGIAIERGWCRLRRGYFVITKNPHSIFLSNPTTVYPLNCTYLRGKKYWEYGTVLAGKH